MKKLELVKVDYINKNTGVTVKDYICEKGYWEMFKNQGDVELIKMENI